MIKKININHVLIFSIFMLAVFPAMTIAAGTRYMPAGLICIIISFLMLLFFKSEGLIKDIKKLMHLMPSKLLMYFLIWAAISAVFAAVFFHISFIKILFSIFLAVVLSMMLPYFLAYKLALGLEAEFLAKFYIVILYVILLFGLIDFIIFYFNISPLDIWYNSTIINARLYKIGETFSALNYSKSGLIPRVQSVFEEPSHFAWFICVNIPIVLSIFSSKYKIFSAGGINLLIKKTIVPVMFIVLFLTQSPINILFGLLITAVFYFSKLKFKLKRTVFFVLISSVIIIAVSNAVMNASPEQKVLYRIYTVISSLNDFQNIIQQEASLGTRLIYYFCMFKVFLNNIIFGCGWGNLGSFLYSIIQNSSILLTDEIYLRFINNTKDTFGYCPSIFFRTAAETGFFGIMLLFGFFIMIKKYAFKIYKNSRGILKDYFCGINSSILIYILLSFYDSNLFIGYFWFIFGLTAGVYLKTNRRNEASAVQNDFYSK